MKFRVSAVQYHLHSIQSFEEFAHQCEHYIKAALEFDTEFILFPEFLQHNYYRLKAKTAKL